MKHTKKLLALVLAMMMAFSMLAIPAMAVSDEDEGIMPLGEVRDCPECGQTADARRTYYTDGPFESAASCGGGPVIHHHCIRTYHYRLTCRSCSYDGTFEIPVRYCLTMDREY